MTAGITGATRVYLHLAHPSMHARTPQVMNAEFARRGVDAVAVSADVAPGDLRLPARFAPHAPGVPQHSYFPAPGPSAAPGLTATIGHRGGVRGLYLQVA